MPDVETVREDVTDYLGEAQAFDAAVGVLLEELEKTGELENTLILMSGDHGIPGFPHGKCNLYDLGVEVALAVRWGKKIPAGRVVEDFVSLPDLCPTILEAAGETPPAAMTARSLLGVLTSSKNGTVDPTRDAVVVGRERHVAAARAGNLPYPSRAIRTADFLYIRNFHPQRWPMGEAPGFGKPPGPLPPFQAIENDTFALFADMDSGPTKSWLIQHRDDAGMKPFMDYAFGLRPAEELYDLKADPGELHNVADDAVYQQAKSGLSERLMAVLKETGDPRVRGDGGTFDRPPYSDPVEELRARGQ